MDFERVFQVPCHIEAEPICEGVRRRYACWANKGCQREPQAGLGRQIDNVNRFIFLFSISSDFSADLQRQNRPLFC